MEKKITLYTSIHDFGQMVEKIVVENSREIPSLNVEDFSIANCFYDLAARKSIDGIKSVSVAGDAIEIIVDKFLYRCDFSIKGQGAAGDILITKDTASEVKVRHSDWFTAHTEHDVNYRLYSPARKHGARPLVLFLHGGGASGEDNEQQLTDTIGAIHLAERCPDMYVMAPQAPSGGMTMEQAFLRMKSKGDPFDVVLGSETENEFDARGWTRWYLAKIADILREMVVNGDVDASRIYVIGMSMGGLGTLKMLSVAPDLFAAAVPICPSMNGESWPILNNLPTVPTFIASSYIDNSASRHAYILRAVTNLWKQGRKDIEYVLFTEKELKAYGIGINTEVETKELYMENHNSWILVLHNEHCILDWMFSKKNNIKFSQRGDLK